MILNLPESLAVTSPPRQRVRVISSDVVTMVKCMSCLVHSPGHCEGSRGVWSLCTPGTPWEDVAGLLHNLVIYFDIGHHLCKWLYFGHSQTFPVADPNSVKGEGHVCQILKITNFGPSVKF